MQFLGSIGVGSGGARGRLAPPSYICVKCNCMLLSYIILLYPDERRPTTVRSNDTLVDTPFQLISGFFHVNQGVLCC